MNQSERVPFSTPVTNSICYYGLDYYLTNLDRNNFYYFIEEYFSITFSNSIEKYKIVGNSNPDGSYNAVKINHKELNESNRDIIITVLKIVSYLFLWPLLIVKYIQREMYPIYQIEMKDYLKQDPLFLKHADDSLKKDKDTILGLAKLHPYVFSYAHKNLGYDISFLREANKMEGFNNFNHSSWSSDEEFVLKVIKSDPELFERVDFMLRGDKDFILKAIEVVPKNAIPILIGYATNSIQQNYEVGLKAAQKNILALNVCKNNKVIAEVKKSTLKIVEENGLALKHLGIFQEDADVVSKAVEQNGLALKYAHDDLRTNKNIVSKAVRQNGLALQYAYALRHDKDIVLIAVEQNGLSLEFVTGNLKMDRKIVKKAALQNRRAFQYASDYILDYDLSLYLEVFGDDRTEMILCIKQNSDLLYKEVVSEIDEKKRQGFRKLKPCIHFD